MTPGESHNEWYQYYCSNIYPFNISQRKNLAQILAVTVYILFPFIAGALSDATGNYFGAFCLAGATICLSVVICLPLRKISTWETRRKYQMNEDLNVLVVSSQHLHQLKDN